METKIYGKKFAKIWKDHGEYIFCGLAVLFCLICVWTAWPDNIFPALTGIFISALMFIRLQFANVEIESVWVRLGWSLINFGMYVLFLHVIPIFLIALAVALIFNIVLYCCIPYVSYLLKLNYVKHRLSLSSGKHTRFNGYEASLLVNMIIFIIFAINTMNKEMEEKEDILFAKTEYVRVISWDKEIIDGNTIYVVKIPGKILGISPIKYPKIRDINSNTQLRVLTGFTLSTGFSEIKRLEIKNY